MTIGILGAGRMGLTLARLFLDAGHPVLLANSRGPSTLAAQVAALPPNAAAARREDLVRRTDVVVLATPWDRTAAAVDGLGPWDGRIVVDTTNNRFGPRPEQVYDLGGRGSSEVVAELLPGARVVKAFNHQPFATLGLELGTAPTERNALFVAGDDAAAKETVAQLIRDIGGEPIDTGGLRDGGRLQSTGGPLAGHGRLLTPSEARALLASAR
jgi:hypothetical protein